MMTINPTNLEQEYFPHNLYIYTKTTKRALLEQDPKVYSTFYFQ